MKEGSYLLELAAEQEEARMERTIDDADRGELRPVSARISASAYEVLERLAERWAISRSALAAKVLESALWDLEPAPESTPKSRAL